MIKHHEDTDLFQETVNFTAAETTFAARLIEKDYFCTVLLEHLAAVTGGQLVFKGGTCLTKVHAGFYRLSEDLDFVIPMEDEGLIALVRKKLAVPGNDSINIGPDRLAELRGQLDSRLKPVLRERDFLEFDLERAYKMVVEVARAVA